jgi:hypothetical protein
METKFILNTIQNESKHIQIMPDFAINNCEQSVRFFKHTLIWAWFPSKLDENLSAYNLDPSPVISRNKTVPPPIKN